MNQEIIRTVAKINCPICNTIGRNVYNNLTDSLLPTEGVWNMDVCKNLLCQTYWLNPAPRPEDIPLLYKNYQTHTDPVTTSIPGHRTIIRKCFDTVRQSVLSQEYDYPTNVPKLLQIPLNFLAKIHPGWRDSQLNQVLYVPFINNGKFLDVGCGGGYAMIALKKMGWNVTGTDFDIDAVKNAQSKGLNVYQGELNSLGFKDESFDAILLSHVIEHVPNPQELLTECKRILKPGGKMIVITPNANSYGHRKFKEHWRGLEVPRHLQIFTPSSLEILGKRAGFSEVEGKTCIQGIFYIWDASEAHSLTGSFELSTKTKWGRLMDKWRLFTSGIKFALGLKREETALLYCVK